MIHFLENTESLVVFTVTNTEKLILLLFLTATFPNLYLACQVVFICWVYSVFKVESRKIQKSKERWVGEIDHTLLRFFKKSTSYYIVMVISVGQEILS